jgi:hypothetical protein
VRIYHPEYRVTWLDRVAELFDVRRPTPPPAGVDLTLIRRTEVRDVKAFLEGLRSVNLLGEELVRCDSEWSPVGSAPRMEQAAAHLVTRLRFGQVLPGDLRLQIPTRWASLAPTPYGSRLLLRLIERPSPGLRSFLAGNLDAEDAAAWVEYAVGAD